MPLVVPLSSMIFEHPALLSGPTAWVRHIPFAFWLVEYHRPDMLVELGTHSGNSYFAFCQSVKRNKLHTKCFAIDTWQGDAHSAHHGELYEAVKVYNDEHYASFSTLVCSTFDEALPHFLDRSIDLLHMDGLHTYDAIRHNFELWLPKLSERAIVLFHGTNVRDRGFGVFRFWNELCDKYPNFEFANGYGLGVLAAGERLQAPVADLFNVKSAAELASIRVAFSYLGDAVQSRWDINLVREAHDQAMQALFEKDQQLAAKEQKLETLSTKLSVKERECEALSAKLSVKEEELKLRCAEQTLKEREDDLTRARNEATSLRQSTSWRLTGPLRSIGRLVRSLYRRIKIIEQRRLIRSSGLFDPAWYLTQNPDVFAAGIDPLQHYLLFGAAEGRQPSLAFDSNWYLLRHRDVLLSGMNPIEHFMRFGRKEGRLRRGVAPMDGLQDVGHSPSVDD